jgi:predicted transcriptional regulator
MTFEEIGAELGITNQYVNKIYHSALKKVKKNLLQRYGTSVKLDDIFPMLDKENIYEQMQSY